MQSDTKKATTFNDKQKTLASKAVASLNGSAKAMAAAQAGLEKKKVASELAASLAEARKKVDRASTSAVDQRASCWNARERPALYRQKARRAREDGGGPEQGGRAGARSQRTQQTRLAPRPGTRSLQREP